MTSRSDRGPFAMTVRHEMTGEERDLTVAACGPADAHLEARQEAADRWDWALRDIIVLDGYPLEVPA